MAELIVTCVVPAGEGGTADGNTRVFRFEFDSLDSAQVAIDEIADTKGLVSCEFLSAPCTRFHEDES
jgi:hypothetical protein